MCSELAFCKSDDDLQALSGGAISVDALLTAAASTADFCLTHAVRTH